MKFLILAMISFSASLIGLESVRNSFIIWNIGQGQWSTRVSHGECWHFDMGGEFFPWAQIEKTCGDKKNIVFLSHWDMDHIGALKKAPRHLHNLCIARPPLGRSSPHKEALIPHAECRQFKPSWEWQPVVQENSSANDLSQIFVSDHFLIPGDSTKQEEKNWAGHLPAHAVKFLLLGHHGSKTSSSDFLMQNLPGLKLAISTARWQRYHHPHPETLARMKKYRIPVLRTEDWGSLHFEI